MSRALLRGAVCQSCRHDVLRSLVAVSGASMPRYPSVPRPNLTSRALSAAGPRRSDRPPTSNHPDIHLSPLEENAPRQENDVSSTSHVPWYLQEEPSTPEARPTPGDHIPKVPENSPEMLPVLLEYVYKDLGLDDLNLVDLRVLDTPAALGANTMMIVGTARSVKHLNVSADRLCRWLRSTYKLSPYADGLLGRNELKIKLRRKAKRARAASQAGTMIDEKDDGITTGWICVNAGVVDKDAARAQLSEAGFEGFGEVDAGTSVVVQIFTEEKRADVDLEGLWQATLDRAERKRLQDSADPTPQAGASAGNPSRPAGTIGTVGQKRGLHTAIGREFAAPDSSLDQSALASILARRQTPGAQVSTESLLEMLTGLPYESARQELGTGPDDRESTIFLRLLYDSLPREASPENLATLRLKLCSIAVSRQHPAYSKEMLFSQFVEYLGACYALPDELAFDIVAALLAPRLAESHSGDFVFYLPEADIELALQVLDRLHFRGVPVLNYKVFNMLYQVVEIPRVPSEAAPQSSFHDEGSPKLYRGHQWTQSQRQMLNRISKMVAAAEVPFDANDARSLMVTLFRFDDYDGFWRLWRMLPSKGVDRTPEDYVRLFRLHAELGVEGRARECLSMWVPMMDRETIPIPLQGPVVDWIMRCLLVADPSIQPQGEDSSSYFQDLWTRCQQALD